MTRRGLAAKMVAIAGGALWLSGLLVGFTFGRLRRLLGKGA